MVFHMISGHRGSRWLHQTRSASWQSRLERKRPRATMISTSKMQAASRPSMKTRKDNLRQYTCIYVYTYIYICEYVCMCVCVCNFYIYICMYVLYVCICIYIYICMYIYIYIASFGCSSSEVNHPMVGSGISSTHEPFWHIATVVYLDCEENIAYPSWNLRPGMTTSSHQVIHGIPQLLDACVYTMDISASIR